MSYKLSSQIATGGDCITNVEGVRAHETVQIELPEYGGTENDPVISWGLTLNKQGVLWKRTDENDEVDVSSRGKIVLIAGGTYHIVVHEENPPLNQEAKDKISKLMLVELERRTPFDHIWDAVYNGLDVADKDLRTLNQLKEAYDGDGHNKSFEWYTPVSVESWPTESELDRLLNFGSGVKIDAYWRAIGRFPGGNADLHTVCYSFQCMRPEPTVVLKMYSNWDGEASYSDATPIRLKEGLSESNKLPKVLEAARSYYLDGARDTEYTFHDTAFDSDEYNSEWTSTEIIVYCQRQWSTRTHLYFSAAVRRVIMTVVLSNQRFQVGGKAALNSDVLKILLRFLVEPEDAAVLRLHRRCVSDPRAAFWGTPASPGEPLLEPTRTQKEMMDAMTELVEMGRVNTWTDAGDDE